MSKTFKAMMAVVAATFIATGSFYAGSMWAFEQKMPYSEQWIYCHDYDYYWDPCWSLDKNDTEFIWDCGDDHA